MSVRTVKCPICGSTNLLVHPCACGGKKKRSRGGVVRALGPLLVFVLTALGIVGGSLALLEMGHTGYAIALAVGAMFVVHLFRLGYDWEDDIDVRWRILPGPFDWPVKLESVKNFWLSPRRYFRAVYLGCGLAMVVVVIVLACGRALDFGS